MSTVQLIEELRHLDNAARLAVIEAATRMVREDVCANDASARLERQARAARDLYEPGGEMTEWTTLDSEEIIDDSVPR